MKYFVAIASLAALLAGTSAGCMRAAGEGLRMTTGLYSTIQPGSPSKENRSLGQYTNFELGSFTNDIGSRLPDNFMGYLSANFDRAIRNRKLPLDSRGKTLLVRGRVIYYESASTFSNVTTPLEEVIARVELVDKDSGKVLGIANCVGRTENTTTRGPAKKGEALAKAIASWISDGHPKGGQEEEE